MAMQSVLKRKSTRVGLWPQHSWLYWDLAGWIRVIMNYNEWHCKAVAVAERRPTCLAEEAGFSYLPLDEFFIVRASGLLHSLSRVVCSGCGLCGCAPPRAAPRRPALAVPSIINQPINQSLTLSVVILFHNRACLLLGITADHGRARHWLLLAAWPH